MMISTAPGRNTNAQNQAVLPILLHEVLGCNWNIFRFFYHQILERFILVAVWLGFAMGASYFMKFTFQLALIFAFIFL